jgi:hypothetical protein
LNEKHSNNRLHIRSDEEKNKSYQRKYFKSQAPDHDYSSLAHNQIEQPLGGNTRFRGGTRKFTVAFKAQPRAR